MKIFLYQIGKIKNQNLLSEILKYSKMTNFKTTILKEDRSKNISIKVKNETKSFLKYLDKKNFNIILDEKGENFSSNDFYKKLKNIDKDICFFISSAYGYDKTFSENFDLKLSLSKFTFPHELSNLVLCEQIYRFSQIEKGSKYHK